MVIDVFSKFAWIKPLKDECGESVAGEFNKIFKAGRKTKMLWTDKGSEFYNKHVKDLLQKNNIKLYSSLNQEKSSIVERFNRTIKNRMWKMFSENNNTVYYDKIDKLVNGYDSRKHSSVQITPNQASKPKNECCLQKFIRRFDLFQTERA